MVNQLGLRAEILAVGLDHGVGTGGRRLTQPQRQKVALVRALVRRPRIFILNNALAPLEAAVQTRILKAMRNEMKDRCLILIADNAALCSVVDRVAVMRDGGWSSRDRSTSWRGPERRCRISASASRIRTGRGPANQTHPSRTLKSRSR